MKKRLMLVGLCVVVFGVGAIAYGLQGLRTGTVPRQSNVLPEHILYNQLFRQLVALKNSSHYKEGAGLNDEQSAALEQIAADCVREVAAQDGKAGVVINAHRERLKKHTESKKQEPLPPAPSELKGMQEERDVIILRHRDRLREALGAEKFGRLDGFARRTLKISVMVLQ